MAVAALKSNAKTIRSHSSLTYRDGRLRGLHGGTKGGDLGFTARIHCLL